MTMRPPTRLFIPCSVNPRRARCKISGSRYHTCAPLHVSIEDRATMKRLNLLAPLLLALLAANARAQETPLRPPAVPLVTHTPYFSIWSPSNALTDADTIHWTGK